ncbi:MAG: hypothetical protein ACFFFT_17455 [Candidatus Thorarchaeota archaeon]
MIPNLNPETIDAFEKIRKVYLLEKFENLSEGTEDVLKSNLENEDYLMDIKSTIELIIESKFENKISEFEELFDLTDLNEELMLARTYLIELLKGDPDVECIKSYIIFDSAAGTLKFGWNHSIFKKDIELVIGLFTAITSFSKEAIERQLKGLSVEGMEFKMIRIENCNLAILFILSREPSPILINRINQFTTELQKEIIDLFLTKDCIDFTHDENVKKKIYDIMVQTLKFDLNKLTEINK